MRAFPAGLEPPRFLAGTMRIVSSSPGGKTMIKIVAGITLGLLIGVGCRWFDIPVPAPPKLIGAVLVVAMTVGYLGADRLLSPRPAATAHLSSGPTGGTASPKN
jgi:XapX domain-containing protein